MHEICELNDHLPIAIYLSIYRETDKQTDRQSDRQTQTDTDRKNITKVRNRHTESQIVTERYKSKYMELPINTPLTYRKNLIFF